MRGVGGVGCVGCVGDGGRERGSGWQETAGGLEQCCAVEVSIGEGEDKSASDGALYVSAEDLQGLQ